MGPTITCSIASLANTLAASVCTLSAGKSAIQNFRSVRTAIRRDAQLADRRRGACGCRIHHPRLGQHVNQNSRSLLVRVLTQRLIPHSAYDKPLDNRIGKQFAGQLLDLLAPQIALNQVTGSGRHLQSWRQSQFTGGGSYFLG